MLRHTGSSFYLGYLVIHHGHSSLGGVSFKNRGTNLIVQKAMKGHLKKMEGKGFLAHRTPSSTFLGIFANTNVF